MTNTNIIIKLQEKGWSAEEILDFMVFVATHNPTEEEVNRAYANKQL